MLTKTLLIKRNSDECRFDNSVIKYVFLRFGTVKMFAERYD